MKVQEECHKDVNLSFNPNVHEMYYTMKAIPFDDFALKDIFCYCSVQIDLPSMMRKKKYFSPD